MVKKFYHFTSKRYLDSISKKGLVPQIGDRCKAVCETNKAVFLTEGMKNAIIMYSLVLYNSLCAKSMLNSDILTFRRMKLFKYQEKLKGNNLDNETRKKYEEEVKKLTEEIEFADAMLNNNFPEFAKNACYLSVEGFDNIYLSGLANYFTFDTIPVEYIKVVTIKLPNSDISLDSIDDVLTYFMSQVDLDDVLKDVDEENGKDFIVDLYETKKKQINAFKSSNCVVEEIPIKSYINSNGKSRKRTEQ